jgi:acyl-CoA synthetase (AMP-forming)/AMP-acid ligase II
MIRFNVSSQNYLHGIYQVIGVPDARLGEEVCAWIRLRPECVATEVELRTFCRDKVYITIVHVLDLAACTIQRAHLVIKSNISHNLFVFLLLLVGIL